MRIRMTGIGAQILTALVAGAVATGGAIAGVGGHGDDAVQSGSPGADVGTQGAPTSRVALVVDAHLARDGRELVDSRLRDVDAEVRLPRSEGEALVNVRYLAALGYRLVVAGPDASAAADAADVTSVRASGLAGALAAGTAQLAAD